MMKETNFGQLLLLLLLAVTPRNSSANRIASPGGMMDGSHANLSGQTVNGTTGGAPANMSGPTANYGIEGVDLLIKLITGLQDNMLSYDFNNFNEIIDNLEKNITNPTSELAVNRREILEVLYRSRDRFTIARSMLKHAAERLKSYCGNLIDIIDTYDASKDLLRYTAQNVLRHLRFVYSILENALIKLKGINPEFTVLKTRIREFNTTLNLRAEEINENENEILQIIKDDPELLKQQEIADKLNNSNETLEGITLVVCVRNLGLFCPLTSSFSFEMLRIASVNEIFKWFNLKKKFDIQNKLKSNIGRQNIVSSNIEDAQESTLALLSQVVVINKYIETERVIITIKHDSLEASFLDREDISIEVIESKLKDLKDRLVVLQMACTSFLNHEFSEILLSREYSMR